MLMGIKKAPLFCGIAKMFHVKHFDFNILLENDNAKVIHRLRKSGRRFLFFQDEVAYTGAAPAKNRKRRSIMFVTIL
jgi:hypothetical protein